VSQYGNYISKLDVTMHYHQYKFIEAYSKGKNSILIFNDVRVDLPALISKKNAFVSDFFAMHFDTVHVADNDWKFQATYKPSQTYDLIVDFRECSIVPKSTCYIILKNMQKAMHKNSVAIHFSPVKGHFPAMDRCSDLGENCWGELLSKDSILETRVVGAYHNMETGQETYIAYSKQARSFTKKRTLDLLSKT